MMKQMDFDIIISNPPYAIGNQVTRAIIDNVEFGTMINLMPASKYKAGQLYEHVAQVESAEDTFEDAAVGDSLTVAVLKKDANVFESYEELEFMKMDPQYVDFYKLNAKGYHYAISNLSWTRLSKEVHSQLRFDVDFVFTTRQCAGNISKDSKVYLFNVEHVDELSLCFDKTNDCYIYPNAYMRFNTSIEKDNFCRFWYNNILMNNLIHGLNKTSGTCKEAIPNIDWSKERDYEHLTLEDLMDILKEEA